MKCFLKSWDIHICMDKLVDLIAAVLPSLIPRLFYTHLCVKMVWEWDYKLL